MGGVERLGRVNSEMRVSNGQRGQSLASLLASALGEKFYSWRGASGARYVCSVFDVRDEAVLRDFSQGLAIGVAREGAQRKPVCLLSCADFGTDEGRDLLEAARMRGVSEWHVHFSADPAAALRDLAASLLN